MSFKFSRDYPGNFNCICGKNNEHSNCTKSMSNNETLPQNVYFLFQPMIRLNEDNVFLLVIESFGSVESIIDISTSKYALINTKVSQNDHKMFKLITNTHLQSIVKRMKLGKIAINHNTVFIATFTDVMVATGHQILKLTIKCKSSSCDNSNTVLHLSYHNSFVFAKSNYCSPKVLSSSCENSFHPREVLLSNFNVLKPTIQRSCGANSSLAYQWSIDHIVEQKTIMNLPNERSSLLQLAPFTLFFDDRSDYFTGYYSIKLIVFEENVKIQKSGMTIWRVRKFQLFYV